MTSKSNRYRSLLVTESTDLDSNQVLIDILNNLGTLQITSARVKISIKKKTYDLIIVDAVSVTDSVKIVSQLRAIDSRVKIIVLSASIHWKIAKAVIKAGATDYLPKSLTKEEMTTNFHKILKQLLVDETPKR